MKVKDYKVKNLKLRYILYLVTSCLPISRRKFNKYRLDTLKIFAAQRELQMMTRQDIILLASRMMKFHGPEIMNNKNINNVSKVKPVVKVKDNTENMFG